MSATTSTHGCIACPRCGRCPLCGHCGCQRELPVPFGCPYDPAPVVSLDVTLGGKTARWVPEADIAAKVRRVAACFRLRANLLEPATPQHVADQNASALLLAEFADILAQHPES